MCCGAGLQNWQCVADPLNRASDDIVGKRGRVLYDGTIPEGGTVCPQAGGPSRLPMDLGNLRYLRAYTLLDREGVMHTRRDWGWKQPLYLQLRSFLKCTIVHSL